MIYFTGILIICLVFTNAITDAPNAISTIVGTKVLSFRKAAFISAIFNSVGIIAMCFINFSVAKNMASLIKFDGTGNGILIIFSGMISTVLFSCITLKCGIPTSETHGLVSGLIGAGIALNSYNIVNKIELLKIILGLFWSIFITYFICKLLKKLLKYTLEKCAKNRIKKFQLVSCLILSFMHGAQDGLKFIGIFIIYYCSLKNLIIPDYLNPSQFFWIIILVASSMAIGVGIGGKTIVENVGTKITSLTNVDAIITDISTGISLFLASIFGIPLSTSHCKTISIISIGEKVNIKNVYEIIKAWIVTFPVCFFISFFITKLLI